MKLAILALVFVSSLAHAANKQALELNEALTVTAGGDCGAGQCGVEVTDVHCLGSAKRAQCSFKFENVEGTTVAKTIRGRYAKIILKSLLSAHDGHCANGLCKATSAEIDCRSENDPSLVDETSCEIERNSK